MDILQQNQAAGGGRKVRVKNRNPAPIQITAEQIMHEAKERQEAAPKAPKQRITDPDELAEYKLRKRKEFEDRLRMQRMHMPSWMRYAEWEASHGEFTRARSVFERAIDVDYQNRTLWLKYAEMEMKNKFINRARNVWDRAVTILPRVDQYWYKYAYMEEMVGNINNARAVFERWMKWEPDDPAWLAYIKLEMRQGEVERARAIYERYVACAFTQQAYLRFAKWEDRQGQFALSRRVYERAIEDLPEDQKDEDLYISFAKFEEKCHEHERARAIFKFGLDKIPKELAQTLYKEFIAFEKKHGNREGIEDVILDKRRFQYEDAIKENSHNYDVWFDYIRLEEANSDPDKVRDVYERAIANVPPVAEKKYWRRYIYLWINYALYEELETKDFPRARDVYSNVLQLVPHESFTFSKLWILAANFEIRRRELAKARLILGKAIGMCPTEKVFKSYIHLELQLGNIDRCRILYEKYLEFMPHNCYAWTKFAELENTVGEEERARAVFELAVSQSLMDMPEMLWKNYIDFEIKLGETENARKLYERLLDRTQHVKVWLAYGRFLSEAGDEEGARDVFKRGYEHFKQMGSEAHEERAMLLDVWRKFEANLGTENAENLRNVESKLPRKIKKRRKIPTEDGSDAGWEEYYDYIFPDDEKGTGNLKILEMAQKWKMGMASAGSKRKSDEISGEEQ